MKTIAKLVIFGLLTLAIQRSPAQDKKVEHVDSSNANFQQVGPGVSKVVLWGDDTKGPYGAFTKFAPGVNKPAPHSHQ